jgi:hypothetical protein
MSGPYSVGAWKCIRRGWEDFPKFVMYEMNLRCGFGMMYGVGSNPLSSLIKNYSLLLIVRMHR